MKRDIYKTLGVTLCLITLIGCNPCKRMTKRHPECFKSITIRDTVKIPEIKADTVFSSLVVRDTVVLQKDRLTVRHYQNDSTVYLSGECRDSVIVREHVVNVPQPVKSGYPWWAMLCVGFALATVLFGLILIKK